MNPTPAELALLAIALSKDEGTEPQTKLPNALALWIEASLFLSQSKRNTYLESLRPPARTEVKKIPFETRLAELMLNLTPAYRRKKFHEYLAEKICKVTSISGCNHNEAKIEELTRFQEEEMKREGVPVGTFEDFPEWAQTRLHLKRAAAGQKGAVKKHANAKAKAATKASKKRKRTKLELVLVGDQNALDAIAQTRENLPD
jgi:hypothetical protein